MRGDVLYKVFAVVARFALIFVVGGARRRIGGRATAEELNVCVPGARRRTTVAQIVRLYEQQRDF